MTSVDLLPTVSFTDLEIRSIKVVPERKVVGPWPKSWTKIEVNLPDSYSAKKKVWAWIDQNLEDRWGSYEYTIRDTLESKMVIGFETRKDAMIFKLSGKNWN